VRMRRTTEREPPKSQRMFCRRRILTERKKSQLWLGETGKGKEAHLRWRIVLHKALHRHANEHQSGVQRQVEVRESDGGEEVAPQRVEESTGAVDVVIGPEEAAAE
jgi:hypothetical protein